MALFNHTEHTEAWRTLMHQAVLKHVKAKKTKTNPQVPKVEILSMPCIKDVINLGLQIHLPSGCVALISFDTLFKNMRMINLNMEGGEQEIVFADQPLNTQLLEQGVPAGGEEDFEWYDNYRSPSPDTASTSTQNPAAAPAPAPAADTKSSKSTKAAKAPAKRKAPTAPRAKKGASKKGRVSEKAAVPVPVPTPEVTANTVVESNEEYTDQYYTDIILNAMQDSGVVEKM